jgi:HK97 family phage portal protein
MKVGSREIRLRFTRRGDHGEERVLSKSNVPAVMLKSTPGGALITPANALDQVADAYACVRALADAAASLPLHVYRARPDGSRERVTTGRAVELLRSPGLGQTTATLVGQIMTALQTHGNAYVAKYRTRGEPRVEQLGLWHPERVAPELKGGRVRFTLTHDKGRQTVHDQRDVLHIRSAVSVDGLTGLSPVRQCAMALGLGANLTKHAAVFFENDGRPGGLLAFPNELNAGQGAAVRARHDELHRGVDNAHKTGVFSGDVKWIPIEMPKRDAQFLESRQLSTVEICRLFRVPAWLLDAATIPNSSITYSNVQMQADFFVRFSLMPWLVLIEEALSADTDLLPNRGPGGRQYVKFELGGLLRADAKSRAETYTQALAGGWLTVEEIRRLEDLEPLGRTDSRPADAAPERPADNRG